MWASRKSLGIADIGAFLPLAGFFLHKLNTFIGKTRESPEKVSFTVVAERRK